MLKQVRLPQRDLQDFYGFGVSIPMTSKGIPKLFEKINTRYDYGGGQMQKGVDMKIKRKNGKVDEVRDVSPKFL